MKHLGFASIAAVKQYLRYAHSQRLDVHRLIQQAALSAHLLAQDKGRIKGVQLQSLLQHLITASGDPLMGLNSSLHVGPQSYSTLGLIVLNCRTLGDAIARIPTFERLVGDMGTTHIQHSKVELNIRWRCRYTEPTVRQHMIDNVLASWTLFARWLVQNQAHALAVTLSRPEPEQADIKQSYRKFFGCEVQFASEQDSISLSHALLALPIKQNPVDELLDPSHLESQARSQLSNLALDGESFSEQVSRSIEAHLQLGAARKELIAEEFNLSQRTLQRKLAREQQSYQALLDRARLARAKELLTGGKFTHEDIAYNLGFADERCFYRSFKRWTGLTPGEFVGGTRAVPPSGSDGITGTV